ncbi:MAG: PQQ-binding-like beta-propeller repeat protein [Planctomycetaceae bacterium]|nr:PQQ-binding-like beta-propeller repeat protein [Planctomycetaceae bacterium]
MLKNRMKLPLFRSCVLVAAGLMSTGLDADVSLSQTYRQTSSSVSRADIESRLGLTRLWHVPIAAGYTNSANEPLRMLIPREATVAFTLTKEAVTGENPVNVPDSVEVIVSLDTGSSKEVVSSRDRGLNGKVLGVKGALRLAEIRKELLEKRGLTVTESVQFVPNARVFAVSSGGQVQAMDAESGEVLWTRRLETDGGPVLGFDVSNDFVAITHGTHIDILNSKTGMPIRTFSLRNLPGGSPVIAGNQVISPGTNGRLELLTPFTETRFRSDMGGYEGRLAVSLTELENAYVWAVTDQVYVSLKPSPARPIYGIPTSDPVQVAPAGFGNVMLVIEDSGELKCFSQSSGIEIWSEYAGLPLVQTPMFVRWSNAAPTTATPEAAPVNPMLESNEENTDDPFGAPTANPSSDPNPSNDSANPFGGGSSDNNPFGGGSQDSNPFGGNQATNPFGADASNPFGASSNTPTRESTDEEETEGGEPTIRQARNLNLDELLGTTDQVGALLVDEAGNVRAIDMRTGKLFPAFHGTGIAKILTVTADRIYATSKDNQLVALDLRTGRRIGGMAIPGDWEGVVNSLSDRIYLQSKTGQVVCFRPSNSVTPIYRRPSQVAIAAAVEAAETPTAPTTSGTEEFNPFGNATPPTGADPFGGAANSGANPFAN